MKIIYEDSQILVCKKEAGLPVQSGRIGEKDLVSILKNRLWEQGGGQKEPYLGVVHRLDQPVEGLLAFAKTSRAAASLSAQLTDGRMGKRYLAAVWEEAGKGRMEPDSGKEMILQHYLCKENRTNTSRIVPEGTKGAKQARLGYRILECVPFENGSLMLVRIRLFTGRHHQIRVQMAGSGMPLAGDRKYAKGRIPDALMQYPLALCADALELEHPSTGRRMTFECEPENPCFLKFSAEV